ncbi:MAG TPA: class I SAM-dependent methyltransferase [Patescibacteria group bacterium]|nr:class I SAM-dependent methyltransferase [Patescibacteria group bacterium]
MTRTGRVAGSEADYVPLNQDRYSGHQMLLRRAQGARTVLDVGCSAGVLARELVARGAVVDGIEQDAVAAAEAARVCRHVIVGDAESAGSQLESAAYDLIVMADLIEHLRDPVRMLRMLRPALGPEGRLLLTTPNVANWSLRLRLLVGRWDYTDRGLLDRTHLHLFTLKTLRAALQEAGYRITDLDVTCPLPVLRRPPFSAIAHAVALGWKGLLAYQFVVAARPA